MNCSECQKARDTYLEANDSFETIEELEDEHPDIYGDALEMEHPDVYEELENTGELEIIGHDSRVRVTNTLDIPFRYTCNFEYDFPSIGRRAMCTGTLIGQRTVLTAGHCIVGKVPSRMRVIPGRDGTLEPLPATQATRFITPRNYQEASATDYGVIHLRDPIGTHVGYWTRTYNRGPRDTVGTSISNGSLPLRAGVLTVNVSGYPADMPSDPRFGCRDPQRPKKRCYHSLLSNPRRHQSCGAYQYRSYDRTVRVRAGILHYLNDTCPGHSGSPVWVRRHPSRGGRVLIGIHVAGDDPSPGVNNRAVLINKEVLRFIVANTI